MSSSQGALRPPGCSQQQPGGHAGACRGSCSMHAGGHRQGVKLPLMPERSCGGQWLYSVSGWRARATAPALRRQSRALQLHRPLEAFVARHLRGPLVAGPASFRDVARRNLRVVHPAQATDFPACSFYVIGSCIAMQATRQIGAAGGMRGLAVQRAPRTVRRFVARPAVADAATELHPDVKSILYSEQTLRARVTEMGRWVPRDGCAGWNAGQCKYEFCISAAGTSRGRTPTRIWWSSA